MNTGDTPQPSTSGHRWTPPSPKELQPEFPPYEILELIGYGGMGAVYRARQLSLDRIVAIKVLPPGLEEENGAYREQFTNEARALGRLSHPNIIAVHEFGTTPGGLYFLCMEYFQGITLYEHITSAGRLQGAKVLPLLMPVCDALHYAHSHGVVHRDIKPENILINSEGHVRVADFGLARLEHIHGAKRREVTLGTPDYVAPEVYNREAVIDGRADIYALGVMLQHMLTGAPLRVERVPASRLVQCDGRFDSIILKATEREPGRRFSTAGEMKDALERIAFAQRTPAVLTAPKPAPAATAPGRVAASASSSKAQSGKAKKKSSTMPLAAGAVAVVAIASGIILANSRKPQKPGPENAGNGGSSAAVASGDTQREVENPFGQEEALKPEKPAPAPAPRPPEVPVAELRPVFAIPAQESEVITGPLGRYQFIPGSFTWVEAKAKAETAGGKLACFKDHSEIDLVVSKLLMPLKVPGGRVLQAWVGAFAETEGKWAWISAEPFAGEGLWMPKQPNITGDDNKGAFPAYVGLGRNSDGAWGLNDLSDTADAATHWRRSIIGYIVEFPPAEQAPPSPVPVPDPVPVTTPMPATAPAASEALKALVTAETNFRSAMERDALGNYNKALAELETQYAGGLTRALTAATQAGKLEEATILQQEQKRLAAKEPLPPTDDAALPASLKQLRTTLRDKLGRLQQDRDRRIKPMYEKYLAWVESRVTELTKQQKLEDARAAKEHHDRIAAEISGSATSTVSLGSKDPALLRPFRKPEAVPIPPAVLKPAGPPQHTRRLAEWVLSCVHGRVTIRLPDGKAKSFYADNKDKLPDGDFTILEIYSGDPPKEGFDPAWLDGESLRNIQLWSLGLGDLLCLRSSAEKLKGLRFYGRDTKPADVKNFPPLPVLTELSLTAKDYDAKCLQIIAERTPALENAELRDFAGTGVVEMGLLWPALEHLTLERMKCSGEDERALAAYPALKSLKLINTEIRIKALKDCDTLTRIQLQGKDYDDSSAADALSMPQIKSFILFEAPSCDGDFLTALNSRKGLKNLRIDKCHFKSRRLELLQTQPDLESLGLVHSRLEDSILVNLPALPALRELSLRGNRELTDKCVPAIAQQTTVERLDLEAVEGISPSGLISIFNSLQKLNRVDVSGTQADLSVLEALVKLPQLNSLYILRTEVDPAAAIPLIASSKSLTWIAVPKTFSDADMQKLRDAKKGLSVNR